MKSTFAMMFYVADDDVVHYSEEDENIDPLMRVGLLKNSETDCTVEVTNSAHYDMLVTEIRQCFRHTVTSAMGRIRPAQIQVEPSDFDEVTLESFNKMLETVKLETKTMGTVSRLYIS